MASEEPTHHPAWALAAERVLLADGRIRPAVLTIERGRISEIGKAAPKGLPLVEAGPLLLTPGLVDLHGDAFERQLMPRPGVLFDLPLAMLDTDRQLAANGITTAFHGLTWSWEPGLRSVATGRAVAAFLARHRAALLVEHRLHVRFELFNLEGLEELSGLIRAGQAHLVAFNDHTPGMAAAALEPTGNIGHAYRALVSREEFNRRALAMYARAAEVPAAITALAAVCRETGLPMLSHDDASPEVRRRFRGLGATICEFPTNLATAQEARAHGEHVVMGAPNVLRGKSHLGWLSALEAVEAGVATVLASDYFYPALLQAPFRLATRNGWSLGEAWALVAANPARAAGLTDRGTIAPGQRADLAAIADDRGLPPRCMGLWRGGLPIGPTRP